MATDVESKRRSAILDGDEVDAAYPWPKDVAIREAGYAGCQPSILFRWALKWLARSKPEIVWVPFFRDSHAGKNALSRLPSLVYELNRLFKSELKAELNASQMAVLFEADCALVGYDRLAGSIVAFASTRFVVKGTLVSAGIRSRVTFGGLMVVSRAHVKAKFGIMMATVIALYGHNLLTIFQREITVLRINNKHLERVMRRAGGVYRYDEVSQHTGSSDAIEIFAAMKWSHVNVFHLDQDSLHVGKPIPIDHRFDERVTMRGLGPREITYVARASSLIRFVALVFLRAGRSRR